MNSVPARPHSQPPPVARARARARKLTAAQLRELDAELRAERARLERSIGSAPTPDDDGQPAGVSLGSLIPGDTDGGLRVALHSRAHTHRDAIDAALQRLADGTYGRCTGCGEPIPFGRLIVMPESARCLACGPSA